MSWVDRMQELFGSNCLLCRKSGNLEKLVEDDEYGICLNWHKNCLETVLANPEKYQPRTIDWAIRIVDEMKRQDRAKERMRKEAKEKIDKCKEYYQYLT